MFRHRRYKFRLVASLLFGILVAVSGLLSITWQNDQLTFASQHTYYVSASSGDDSNSGQSTNEAWQTLDQVANQTFAPGDRILFACGETFSSNQEMLTLFGSGTASNPIVIGAYPDTCTNSPILENTNKTVDYNVVLGISGDYWYIQDIAIKNTDTANLTETGITLQGSFNTVEDVDISGTGFGIKILGDNNSVYNSTIHDLVMMVNDSTPDNDYGVQGVVVSENSNTIIHNNHFYNLRQPSQDYGEDGAALEIYKSVNNLDFAYNLVENVEALTEMGSNNASDLVSNASLHHNLVINATTLGIFHNDGASAWSVGLQDVLIDNNTFVRNMTRSDGVTFWFASAPSSPSVSLRNNIFQYQNMDYWSGNLGSTLRENNLYNLQDIYDGYGGDLTSPNYILDSSELKGDPGFVNQSSGDFRLTENSPAVDTGSDLGYSEDFDGTLVPQGAYPDLGAFEFIDPALLPEADFTATPTHGYAPLEVSFTDEPTNNVNGEIHIPHK
jgi:hypothetical protein